MTNPCEIGFRCPHCSVSDEGDDICIHPYTAKDCPAGELFGMIEETICPLVVYPSPMYDLLDIYVCFSHGTSPSEAYEANKEIIEKIKAREEAKREVKEE